jgi:hypothetical protein
MKRAEMKAGERWHNLLQGKPIDRLPLTEWVSWWGLTIERWMSEGMKGTYNCFPDILRIQRSFGLDGHIMTRVISQSAETPVAPHFGAGIMKTPADYEKIRKTMFCDPSVYCPKEHVEWMKKTRAEGDVIHCLEVFGFFWLPRDLFGIEPHLYSFYDEPELLHRICRDHIEWLKKVLEFVGNTFQFDYLEFAEDMSYNHGPMLSKETFDEFLAPYYKEIIPLIHKAGLPVFIDSDGDITKAVDWYAEVGADAMLPLERQAGVDVSLYIDKHPEMTFLGHFDKMCMKFGEAAMRAEFERLLPSARRGKLIISVDHQTPPDVSLENYKAYARLFREYAVKAAQK